jgi:rhodanese-related sulfurtransferase
MAGRPKESRVPTRRFHVPSAVRRSPARVDAQRAKELVAAGARLLDVRRLDDPAVTLPGAVRMPPDEVAQRLGEFPRDVPIVLACG